MLELKLNHVSRRGPGFSFIVGTEPVIKQNKAPENRRHIDGMYCKWHS